MASGYEFVTLDSGKRQEFSTGARRDTEEGKPKLSLLPTRWLRDLALALEKYPDARIDLVPIVPFLRYCSLLGRGAVKYGERNYEKGMDFQRVWDSGARHMLDWKDGDRVEDHLAAWVFAGFALMLYEGDIVEDKLPLSLVDIPEVRAALEALKTTLMDPSPATEQYRLNPAGGVG